MPSPSELRYELVVVVPVRDEAVILERSIRTILAVCERVAPAPWLVVIADNGSTDGTAAVAARLAAERSSVVVQTSRTPGKGRAIREAWRSTSAQRYCFTDVDLSVDVADGLPKLLRALDGGADLAAGARSLPGSVVVRPAYRQLISWGYRLAARAVLGTRLHDLPCGFKGVTDAVVRELVPQVENDTWFFDSELLLLAEAEGYRIAEVPVRWVEYRYAERPRALSLVNVSWQYLRALANIWRRLRRTPTLPGRRGL